MLERPGDHRAGDAGSGAGEHLLATAAEHERFAALQPDHVAAAAGMAEHFAVEAVALGGPVSLVDDAGRMASELVASAIRHTSAPVELTVDAGDDVVRIEVRDDDASFPGSGRVVSFERREASTDV